MVADDLPRTSTATADSAPAAAPDEDTIVEPRRPEEEHVEEAEEEAVEKPPAQEPPAPEEPGAPVEDSEAIAFATAEEQRIAHRLDPLKPRPRRRWLFFGPYAAARGARRGRQ